MVVEKLAYCLEVNKHSIRVGCYADLFEKNKLQSLLSEKRRQRPAVQPLAGVAWHLQHQGLEKRSSGSDTDRRHLRGVGRPFPHLRPQNVAGRISRASRAYESGTPGARRPSPQATSLPGLHVLGSSPPLSQAFPSPDPSSSPVGAAAASGPTPTVTPVRTALLD